jgi:hypothetical protein
MASERLRNGRLWREADINKNRWPVSRHVSFVRIWKLEVAPRLPII